MKFTKYFELIKVLERKYIYNFLNSSLIEIDDNMEKKIEEANIENNLSVFNEEELAILVKQGFLRENDIIKANKPREILDITIAVSNNCNFDCGYCFERESLINSKRQVNNIDREKLKKNLMFFVEKASQGKKAFFITWFGGEPLLEYELIKEINTEMVMFAERNGLQYACDFVTNGFLLTEKRIMELKNQNVKQFQITVDGGKESHNKRRTTTSKIDTFTVIMNNIKLLTKHGLYTVVRVNVDKSNFSEIDALLEELIEINMNKNSIFVALGQVTGTKNSMSNKEFNDFSKNYLRKCYSFGLSKPFLNYSDTYCYCSSEMINNGFHVDIFGNIYFCDSDFFNNDKKYMTLENYIQMEDPYEYISSKNQEWHIQSNASIENRNKGECLKCKYLPLCRGLCPNLRADDSLYENCKENATNKLVNEINDWLSVHNYDNI